MPQSQPNKIRNAVSSNNLELVGNNDLMSPRTGKSFDDSSDTSERWRFNREAHYGRFQQHQNQEESQNMRNLGFTAKFMGSNNFQEEVFNGVFYNLDAQVEQEFQYESADELY